MKIVVFKEDYARSVLTATGAIRATKDASETYSESRSDIPGEARS